ncbi:uncharacterized protein LOC126481616 [Schistocerca serialis cubense]|uniref:uncharacterized protein LOC126481616 n=1 Tax=Schistocerca serialis cubense TaxID=2023355 RepID=UPI00214F419E|nr:uncharacterized protein LOC126481616 [Schistocerca serialis cubense]
MDTDDTASGSGAQKRRTVPDDDRIIERKIPRTTERDSAEQRFFDRLFGPPPEEMQQEAMEAAPCRTALSAEAADPAKKMDTDETASGSGARNRRTVPCDDRKIERRIPRITERNSPEDRGCDWMIGFAPVEVQPGRWPLVPRTAAPVPEEADSVNKMDTDDTASGSGAQEAANRSR